MPTQLPSRETKQSATRFPLVLAVVYAVFALVLRFAPLPENFACIGGLALFCGLSLSGAGRWLIPIATLFVADCIGQIFGFSGMGFYSPTTMILNYMGFAAFTGVGALFQWVSRSKLNMMPEILAPVGCVAGSFVYFLISNFGSWLDPRMAYEQSLSGLMNCYISGLPFWRTSLFSDVVFGCGFVFVCAALQVVFMKRTISARS